jgi:hypothetical protein
MAIVMLFTIISFNIYHIIYDSWRIDLSDIILGTMAVYGFIRNPAFYCRHCFKEVPLKEEDMLNKPFLY